MDKINFTFIVHSGSLEAQGVLLASSIRFHYGNEANIYIGVPKHLGGINNGMSDATKYFLNNLSCRFFEVVNPIGNDYLIGNKLNCFPPNLKGIKIFLDTDTLLLKKLNLPKIPKDTVAIKPADKKTYKWSDEDWKTAYLKYADYSLTDQDYIYSTTFLEPMRPYYNAGVIFSYSTTFEKEWGKMSLALDMDSSFEVKRPWLDQLALPLVLKKHDIEVIQLDENFNYPGHLKDLPKILPEIIHYHQPNIIAQDHRLIDVVIKLLNKFPALKHHLDRAEYTWTDLTLSIEKYKSTHRQFYINKKTAKQNHFITGIPRSGTSYFCSLLDKYDSNLIINEPKEVIFPLNKQSTPYGINNYYKMARQNVYLDKAINNKHIKGKLTQDTLKQDDRTAYRKNNLIEDFNLFTKNTIVYLLGIERLKELMPDSQIFALFRNPVDTIASWSTGFEHLQKAKPFDIKTFKLQQQFLPADEVEILILINETDCIWTRRCMLWNFFAQRLIKNKHLLWLIPYEKLVQNPEYILTSIMKDKIQYHEPIINFSSSNIRSKKGIISAKNISKINLLTKDHYSTLMSCFKLK